MSVTTDVTTTGDTVTGRFTLRGIPTVDDVKKPAFAAFGLVDLALEQVKDVPPELQSEVAKAQARLAELPTVVKTLPAQAQTLAGDLETRATRLYAELAVRGERLVTSIRRQPATEAAIAEGKEAVRKAEAAATAGRKAARAGEQAVEDAAKKIG